MISAAACVSFEMDNLTVRFDLPRTQDVTPSQEHVQMTWTPSPTEALGCDVNEFVTRHTTVRANIRGGPGTQYGVVVVVNADTPVRVNFCTALNPEWIEVEVLTIGRTGWIHKDLIR